MPYLALAPIVVESHHFLVRPYERLCIEASIPRMLRRSLLLLLLLSLALSANTSRAQQPPITARAIKVETRVVLVDIVVTDKQGQAVPGLRKENFRITEDGLAQSISSFDEHKGFAPVEIKLPPMPPNVFTNFPVSRSADSVNVLLLDLLNTTLANQSFVRQQVLQFLGEVKPGTRLARGERAAPRHRR